MLLRTIFVLIAITSLGGCTNGGDRSAMPASLASSRSNAQTSSGTEGNSTLGDRRESRQLVESRESTYNNIYVYRTGSNLSMTFGYNQKIYTESIFNTIDEGDLPVPYTRFMASTLMYAKRIGSILEIGSGGGRTSWYLHRFLPDAQVTSVELDPVVAELAQKYFGIREEPNYHVVTRDGRIFLAASKTQYDVILIDAYRGPFVPFHLLTKEFYQIVKQHLADGGVLAQNIEPATMLFDSDVNTLHQVFSQMEFYDASGTNAGGNVVLIAYDGDGRSFAELSQRAEQLRSQYNLRYDLGQMLWHRFGLKPVLVGQKLTFDVVDQSGKSTAGIDENAKVLTDDFAPVESLKAIENHNRRWATASQ